MPFKYEELMTQITQFKDGKDGAWVVVLGCAPGSAECPDGTQPTKPYALAKEINYQDIPDATKSINLAYLQKALEDKLAEIKSLEAKASSEEEALRKQKSEARDVGDEGKERE